MDIEQTDELQVITDKLDKIYLCDKHTMTFKDFYSHKRTARVNINDFLVWDEFCIKNYVNLKLLCQKEFRLFCFE